MKQVKGILRTNKFDLEKYIQKEIPLYHPVMICLVEYAAWMLNVRVVGTDSTVPFERVRRRPFHKQFLPFGELVNVLLPLDGPARARRRALDARAVEGIMLGYGNVSNFFVV